MILSSYIITLNVRLITAAIRVDENVFIRHLTSMDKWK